MHLKNKKKGLPFLRSDEWCDSLDIHKMKFLAGIILLLLGTLCS